MFAVIRACNLLIICYSLLYVICSISDTILFILKDILSIFKRSIPAYYFNDYF